MAKRIIRVFPRRIRSTTPADDLVRIGCEPGLFDEADEIHISVAFTWDLPIAEKLERQWRHVAPTEIGGPATGASGGCFVPGRYLRFGYVITSRGCPNDCWFCSVWKREGREIRELPITDGWNVLDDNLLACSRSHIQRVFDMLARSKHKYRQPVEFTGGLEAANLEDWHITELQKLRPKQMFFAYDTADDLPPLVDAGKRLIAAGWTPLNALRAYVLCGYPRDTFDNATERMMDAIRAGFMPMAMLYRDATGARSREWMNWQRRWARPAIARAIAAGNLDGETDQMFANRAMDEARAAMMGD